MTKEKYLNELQRKLKRLPSEEIDAALDYYSEYFDEAGEENASQVIKKLGSPSNVASQILAEYAVKGLDNHPESTKKGLSAVWLILLAIPATPIALPLLLIIFALVFSIIAIGIAFIVSFFALIIALLGAGIASTVVGIIIMIQHVPTSIFFIGLGLTATGVGILLFPPLVFLVKSASRSLAKWLKKLFDKITPRRKEEI